MTDTHGQQHDQGDTLDPGLAEWERELIEQQQHDRGERRLIRSRWPKPVGRDTVDLAEAMDAQGQHEPGDQGDVRARQIAAARAVLVAPITAADAGRDLTWLAAELVDAVHAAGGPDDHDRVAGQALADPEVRAGYRREAEARGYERAVANLRDDEKFGGWTISDSPDGSVLLREHFADYLEAVGPGTSGEVHHIERRDDGVTAEEHTFSRQRLTDELAKLPTHPGIRVLIGEPERAAMKTHAVPPEYLAARHGDGTPTPADEAEAHHAILHAARLVTGWPTNTERLPLEQAIKRLATALYDHQGITTGNWSIR